MASAIAGCGLLASLFVGSLYLAPKVIRDKDYSDPVQIKWRLKSIATVSALAPLVVLALDDHPVMESIGIRKEGFVNACLYPLAGIVALFSGPLLANYLTFKQSGASIFPNSPDSDLMRFRNLVAAPFSEELVFRGCMAPILLAGVTHAVVSGFSPRMTIWCAPLFFGVAHLHHAYGKIRKGFSVKQAGITALVQFVYTSLFGALEMFYFLRTGHLCTVVLIHGWCNLMGLPSFEFRNKENQNFKNRNIITLAYVGGIVLFLTTISSFTDPFLFANSRYSY